MGTMLIILQLILVIILIADIIFLIIEIICKKTYCKNAIKRIISFRIIECIFWVAIAFLHIIVVKNWSFILIAYSLMAVYDLFEILARIEQLKIQKFLELKNKIKKE